MRRLGALLLPLVASSSVDWVRGDTITVPTDHATVQAALDASLPGDQIVLLAGVYSENLIFGGKPVTLRSADPTSAATVAATVVDGGHAGPVVIFFDGEGRNSVLDGLTIRNGATSSNGGGIRIVQSSPTIRRCVIQGNTAAFSGGGIYVDGTLAAPLIEQSEIVANTATSQQGGGVAVNGASPVISRNNVHGNIAAFGGGLRLRNSSALVTNNAIHANVATTNGGAIYSDASPSAVVRSNTIIQNSCASGAGGIRSSGGSPTVVQCILWGNGDDLSNSTATYSDVEDGDPGAGNISLDPDLARGDFHLSPTSPCVNRGDPGYATGLGDTDFDGDPRVLNGRVDIGADEVDLGAGVTLTVGNVPEGYLQVFVSPPDLFDESYGITPFVRNYDLGTLASLSVPAVSQRFFVRWVLDGVPQPLGQVTIQVEMNQAHEAIAKFVPGGTLLVRPDVGGDFTTIQAAIDASTDGDIIVVRPATYTERINFLGKAIVVQSMDPGDAAVVAATIVDGQAGGHVVTFNHGEGTESILRGVTITNGRATGSANCDSDTLTDAANVPCGGGVYAFTNVDTFTSPTVEHCVIRNNAATGGGGGVFLKFGSARLFGNVIEWNTATFGAGVATSDISGNTQHNPVLEGNRIRNNRANTNGGGVFLTSRAAAVIRSNIVAQNRAADNGGGGIYHQANAATIKYCTVADNVGGGIRRPFGTAQVGNSIILGNGDDLSNITSTYCNVGNGDAGQGNISVDPQFVDPDSGVYNLVPTSPCIDAGQPGLFVLPTELDIDREPRVAGQRLDMGADEVTSSTAASILWLTSTPDSGVQISYAPPDEDALGPGLTPFYRAFVSTPAAPLVTLSAPRSTASGGFYRWVLDEQLMPVGQAELLLLMNQNHVARAEYNPLLLVQSNIESLPVIVSPADLSGQSQGTVPLTLTYDAGTAVAVEAPIEAGEPLVNLVAWYVDGDRADRDADTSVLMSKSRRVAVVYATPPHQLTVGATLPVSIQTGIEDVNGQRAGIPLPSFTRTFHEGVEVELSAPLEWCTSAFQHWLVDGIASEPGKNTAVVTMDADRAATAVYSDAGPDCDANGVPDLCDLGSGSATDCNHNDVLDACDILAGKSVDCDHNGLPDECEADSDMDGVSDPCDNCPLVVNADQADNDGDGTGNVCDNDDDNDGVPDAMDGCPLLTVFSSSGCGGAAIAVAPCADADRDAVCDEDDNCPDAENPAQADGDNDGVGNLCDNCMVVYNPDQADSNGDGVGDACEPPPAELDTDQDGVVDEEDNCPDVANNDQSDLDGDEVGDLCDDTPGTTIIDTDADGVTDEDDNCPTAANADQVDSDENGVGDACDEPEPGREDAGLGRICGNGVCGAVGTLGLWLPAVGLWLTRSAMRRRVR
jgi:hypothetical protein